MHSWSVSTLVVGYQPYGSSSQEFPYELPKEFPYELPNELLDPYRLEFRPLLYELRPLFPYEFPRFGFL